MGAPDPRPRVLIADDHVLLLEAFQRLLEPRCDIVGTASDGVSAVEATRRLRPDVLVLDISMPRLNGLDAARQVRAELPATQIVFLTVNEDPDVIDEALTIGAAGYLLKSAAASDLFAAIECAMQGETYVPPYRAGVQPAGDSGAASSADGAALTERQRDVVRLVARGGTMKEIARELGITQRTVAFHKYRAMQQLGVRTTAELVAFAVRSGIAGR